MTLLIASVENSCIWMVADTAITGGDIAIRDRAFCPKITTSTDGRALIGFAGEQHHGSRLLHQFALQPAGPATIRALTKEHRNRPSVDFAYAYLDEGGFHLFRVSGGGSQEVSTLHLGLSDAFEHFQRVRHDPAIDFAPEAIKTFICGSRAPEPIPQSLSKAITSMLRLFAERSERDVGGWPVPYLLTKEGAHLCGYGYAVSDPLLTKIGPGSVVPHGTTEAGGFGLSFTELGEGKGMVVNWLQRPGGTVFQRIAEGYKAQEFNGMPSLFKEKVAAELGQKVDLMFSDRPHGQPESITVMRDEAGLPSMAIARHGDSFSFSVLNVGSPFRSSASLNLKAGNAVDLPGGALEDDRISIAISDDRTSATVNLIADGKPTTRMTLQAKELLRTIELLAEARAVMSEQVPFQPPQASGTRELMILNPTWRTEPPIHAALGGITLRLRHPGCGWLNFLLPHDEAKALGKWLSEYNLSKAPKPDATKKPQKQVARNAPKNRRRR